MSTPLMGSIIGCAITLFQEDVDAARMLKGGALMFCLSSILIFFSKPLAVFLLGANLTESPIVQASVVKHLVLVLFGRAILGLGEGLCFSCLPRYMSEIVPAKHRAPALNIQEIQFVLGNVYGAVMVLFYQNVKNGWVQLWTLPVGWVFSRMGATSLCAESPSSRPAHPQDSTLTRTFSKNIALPGPPHRAGDVRVVFPVSAQDSAPNYGGRRDEQL